MSIKEKLMYLAEKWLGRSDGTETLEAAWAFEDCAAELKELIKSIDIE